MSHQHLVIVIDEHDNIIEKIDVTGQNSTQVRDVERSLRVKYKGRKVTVNNGYLGVSEDLFESSKALLEKCRLDHPELFEEVFVKERPEFKHLGYKLKKLSKKEIKELRKKHGGTTDNGTTS